MVLQWQRLYPGKGLCRNAYARLRQMARRVKPCAAQRRHRGSLPHGAFDPPESLTLPPRAAANPGTRTQCRSKPLNTEAPGQRSSKTRSPIRSAALSSAGWSNRSDRRALHARNAMARTVLYSCRILTGKNRLGADNAALIQWRYARIISRRLTDEPFERRRCGKTSD